MKGLLDGDWFSAPHCTTPRLPTFADDQVSVGDRHPIELLGPDVHECKVRKVERVPPHICVAQIPLGVLARLCLGVKHLPKRHCCNIAKRCRCPSRRHGRQQFARESLSAEVGEEFGGGGVGGVLGDEAAGDGGGEDGVAHALEE